MWSGGRWCTGVVARRSAPAGPVRGQSRERPAGSGALAGRAGTQRRCPRAGEPVPAGSTRGGWQGRGRQSFSACAADRQSLASCPNFLRSRRSGYPGTPGSGSGGGWLRAGAAAAGCTLAPGSGTHSSLPYPPNGWLATPHLPRGSALSRGSQGQGPVLHNPILSVGSCFPQRPASIPDLRGQAKATSLLSLDPCSELRRSPAGPRLSPRRPQSLAPAGSFLVRGIPHFSGLLGA